MYKGSSQNRSIDKQMDTEERMMERIELRDKVLEFAEYILPLLEGDAKVGDITKMLDRMAPVAVMRMMDTVVNGKGSNALNASKELLHMAGYKPVEKSISISDNIERMSEDQLDSFLKNALTAMNDKEKDSLVKMIEQPDGSYAPVEVETL